MHHGLDEFMDWEQVVDDTHDPRSDGDYDVAGVPEKLCVAGCSSECAG